MAKAKAGKIHSKLTIAPKRSERAKKAAQTRAANKVLAEAVKNPIPAETPQTINDRANAGCDGQKEYQPKRFPHPSELMSNEDCAKFYNTIACLRTEAMALEEQARILWSRKRALNENPALINVFGEVNNKEVY